MFFSSSFLSFFSYFNIYILAEYFFFLLKSWRDFCTFLEEGVQKLGRKKFITPTYSFWPEICFFARRGCVIPKWKN